eukprot:476023_1
MDFQSCIFELTSLIKLFSEEIKIDDATGYIFGKASNRPIDPKTQQLISKNAYKKWLKLQASKLKKEQRARDWHSHWQNKLNSAPIIKEDTSLPPAIYIKIKDTNKYINKRVEIRGWIPNKKTCRRRISSQLMFIDIMDDVRYSTVSTIQCVLTNDMCNTKEAMQFKDRTTLTLRGKIVAIENNHKYYAYDHELLVDYYELCDPLYFMIKPISLKLSYTWREMSELLICRYIGNIYVHIPKDIEQLLILFLGDIWNDTWDLTDFKTKSVCLTFEDGIIAAPKIKSYATPVSSIRHSTIFGSKVVCGYPLCQKFTWKIQIIRAANAWGFGHHWWNALLCVFGIIPVNKLSVCDADNNAIWVDSDAGYGVFNKQNTWMKWHGESWRWCQDASANWKNVYDKPLKELDILGIHLDLKDGTLGYSVNGVGIGIAFDNIPVNNDYKLAVTMGCFLQQIKLLNI